MAYSITIDGVSQRVQIGSLVIQEQANTLTLLEATIASRNGTYRPDLDDEVIVTENGTTIFGGHISRTQEKARPGAIGGTGHDIHITATGYNALADRRNVIDGGFPEGYTVKQALTSLVGYLTDYGVTLDSGQVDGPTLPELVYDVKSITAILNEIASLTGYVWEITPDKELRMYNPGTEFTGFNLTEGDGNTIGDILVSPTRDEYANRVILLAGTGQNDVSDEVGTGDGVEDTFTLNYTLVTDRGYVTNNGVNETLGSGATWTYDSVTNTITRSSPPANGNAIVMPYTAQFPLRVQFPLAADEPTAEQTAHELWEKVLTASDVFLKATALAMAEGHYNRMVAAPFTVEYVTRNTAGVRPGQLQSIVSTARNLSDNYLIQTVTLRNVSGNLIERTVTAISGLVLTQGWGDTYKLWAGGGTGGATAVGGGTVVVSGLSGSGTSGTLAQWTGASSLGDATAVPAALLTGTIAGARLPQFLGGDVVTSGAGSVVLALQSGVVFDTNVNSAAAIAWTKISKTGSSLADLTTRSAGDLSSGNLAYARMPTGSGTWSATPTISGSVTFGTDLLVSTGYFSNIGALTKKFLTLHCAELWVETLVAQNTIATIGGRVLVGPTNILAVDASTLATSLTFKYNNFANGDRIYFEANGAVEWMAVTSSASGSAGAYVYTVTRNLDGSGANAWTAGDAAFNTGTTGKGFIDLYSTAGVLSGSGPTIVGNVRTGTTYSNIAPRWAIGNLNGVYGYVAETYGAAFGDPSNAWIKIDTTNGIRIGHNTTTKIALDASGSASFSEGNVTIDSTGIALIANTASSLYSDSNAYRFTVSSGSLGMGGVERASTNERKLFLQSIDSGSTKTTSVKLFASGNGGLTGAQITATATPSTDAITLSTLTGDISIGAGTAGRVLIASLFTASGFGSNLVSAGDTGGNLLTVANTTSGTGNYAALTVEAGTNTTSGLYAYSQGYTTTGQSIADSLQLFSSGAGGLNFTANHGSGRMRFKVASNLAFEIDANGDVVAPVDSTQHIGVPSRRFAYMTALAFNLTDMSLENGWSLTESYRIGIAEEGIALVNKTGTLIAFFGEETLYTKKRGDIDDLPYHVTTLAERLQMDPTPEIRVKGHDAQGREMFKTRADVRPMPDPSKAKSTSERKGLHG